MDYDAIIIGGGLAGLSAGAILARQGKRVVVLEQHYIPGGCATTFKRRDFIMEAGLHAMDGHLVNTESQRSILRYLGVHKKVQFEPLPEFYRIRNQDFDFTFPNGSEPAIEALTSKYPEDQRGIRKFFSTILGVQDELSKFPQKPIRQAIMIPLFPILFPNIFKTYRQTLGKFLDKHISNDELKIILQGNLLYYHDDPYSMSMVFFSKAQASFIQYGGHFIKGGSQKLSDSLTEVIRAHGGTVLLGKHVSRILVENRTAVGVSFNDAFNAHLPSEEINATHIIHSGALPLVMDLLTGNERDKIKRKIRGMQPSCALFCIYIGFSKEVREINPHHYSTFIFGDQIKKQGDIYSNIYGDWENKSFVFVDYSQVDSQLAPEGKSFGAICTASEMSEWKDLDEKEYKRKKEELAQILFKRLEQNIPGISELIEEYEVGTPITITRYTMNPSAAPYGFAQIPSQVGRKRPAYKSPVRNLWLSGTWTFPGGGFTGALVSGFLCGMQVSKKLEGHSLEKTDVVYTDHRVVKLIRRTEIALNTMELTFEKPEGFIFLPGQYAIVSLNNPDFTKLDMPLRSLSLASHPDEDHVTFIMRKSESSFKKSCNSMNPGDTASIYGPAGEFVLKDRKKGIVFLASGIGITPVIPFLKELEKIQYKNPIFLFSSNRSEQEAACHQTIQEINIRGFKHIPVFTRTQGRIDEELIKNKLGDPESFEFYVIGSNSFIESMTNSLETLGIPGEDIHIDDFG